MMGAFSDSDRFLAVLKTNRQAGKKQKAVNLRYYRTSGSGATIAEDYEVNSSVIYQEPHDTFDRNFAQPDRRTRNTQPRTGSRHNADHSSGHATGPAGCADC